MPSCLCNNNKMSMFRLSHSFLRLHGPCIKRLLHKSCCNREKWDLFSAICLQRFPVISCEMNELEKKYSEMLEKIEFENSVLSDHELKLIEEAEWVKRVQSDDYEETEEDRVRVSLKELKDKWENELSAFPIASKLTEADESNDQKSLRRKLDEKLILIVKQKLDNKSQWRFPQSGREEGESLREASARMLEKLSDGNIKAHFMGNAPCGFYKYEYDTPVESENDTVGAKVFFFKAHLQSGQVKENTHQEVEDYLWLTKNELETHLDDKQFHEAKKFIFTH